jgi:hypothetical protein
MITAAVVPAAKSNNLVDMGGIDLAAVMGAHRISGLFVDPAGPY